MRQKNREFKYLTPKQMDKFFELMEFQKGPFVDRDILIFRLLYETACRVTEFSKLRRMDVDFERNVINIPAQITKSKKSRSVPMSATTSRKLNNYIIKRKDNYIFESNHKRPIATRTIQFLCKKYFQDKKLAAELSISFIPSPHSFRHSAAIKYVQGGMSIPALQTLLSHHFLETTQVYVKLSSADALSEMDKININW